MSKRTKFFLSHFAISSIIALLFIGIVFLCWYPAPLAKAVGVTHIFLMLIAIDVIVGPVLGFIVYKEGKKTLKMDLSVIILLQITALCYGIYSINQARPAWIAFNYDRFELVRYNQIKTEHLANAQPQYQTPSLLYPQYIAVKQAEDPQAQQIEKMNAILNGISLAQYPDRYIALDQVKAQIQTQARDLTELEQWNDKNMVQKYLKDFPKATAWLPLETFDLAMVVLVNKETSEVVKIVDLRPWK